MKNLLCSGLMPGHSLWLSALIHVASILPVNAAPDSTDLHLWLSATTSEWQELHMHRQLQQGELTNRLETLHLRILGATPMSCDEVHHWLAEKIRLEMALQQLEEEAELNTLRLRYRKSIEMLKMLYEKILSMDHHFTSLKTHHQVLRISNPHEYPEFKEVKASLEERMKKKAGFTLPPLMESNPYLSAVFSIVGLTLGTESKMNREQMERISCILDFTVRMHNDLSVIYYEAGYLRDANLSLKQECEALFAECARQIGYTIPLSACRDSDDWERLYTLLDQFITRNQTAGTDLAARRRAHTNLQFSIDRVVRFIDQYSAFVQQGNEYYKKFAKIAAGYDNEQACSDTLPEQFRQLKTDIRITLEKFNSAYNLPEIQGSRLKDLLYGHLD